MLEYFKNKKEALTCWATQNVHGHKAKFWLALLSFSEASFFLIPPDVLLIAVLVANAQRWLFYSFFTTIFSVLGGIFGYILGLLFFGIIGKPIIAFYHLQPEMAVVAKSFSNNAFLTIFLSAFTPIPYKLFTISAGFFKINFYEFIVASILGRGMRFFAVGFFMRKFGKRMVKYLVQFFDIVSLITLLLVAIIIVLYYWYF